MVLLFSLPFLVCSLQAKTAVWVEVFIAFFAAQKSGQITHSFFGRFAPQIKGPLSSKSHQHHRQII
jgi:hypothetical protein